VTEDFANFAGFDRGQRGHLTHSPLTVLVPLAVSSWFTMSRS
jgi:hypothetical protein